MEYPVNLKIEYPDRILNRLTSFFRPFLLIPIAIVLPQDRRGEGRLSTSWLPAAFFHPHGAHAAVPRKYPRCGSTGTSISRSSAFG
jgi:hypothetical protein